MQHILSLSGCYNGDCDWHFKSDDAGQDVAFLDSQLTREHQVFSFRHLINHIMLVMYC